MRRYIDGREIKVGDIFTDGSDNQTHIRLKNRAKVLYVDKFTLVWFPLNDFTIHSYGYKSNTWCLSSDPKKVEMSELIEDELKIYNSSNEYLV